MDRSQPFLAVEILSDDDSDNGAPSSRMKSPKTFSGGSSGSRRSASVVDIDDDPTPQKHNPVYTPFVVSETPLSSAPNTSIVRCSLYRSNSLEKLAGVSRLICLESDNDSEGASTRENLKESRHLAEGIGKAAYLSRFTSPENPRLNSTAESEYYGLFCQVIDVPCETDLEIATTSARLNSSEGYTGDSFVHVDDLAKDLVDQASHDKNDICSSDLRQSPNPAKRKRKQRVLGADNESLKLEVAAKRKKFEYKIRLLEERKQKKKEDKLQKEALKAEAAELKKLGKEKKKWEKGKHALKSIIAEIDAKVLENGSIGGHLLTRFADRGLSYRITSNPIEKSVLWKMTVPENIAQLSNMTSEVSYILLICQAEEFCDLVISESLINHVHTVRSHYPLSTICYLTYKLTSFINKCEQSHYKSSLNFNGWKRPPVEEALANLSTHFTKVHSRQCIDEAEIADHIVCLTSSLASCQFRKKLTWLSVNANGSIISKDFIDKKLIQKNVWLKALVAIPKVQPRQAVAIWKKYPTMRSLLDVYLDSSKTVHEKEFLLKDLMVEGLLGREDRRLGEVCSKRIYRILMAQSGNVRTDDVEDGSDLFKAYSEYSLSM